MPEDFAPPLPQVAPLDEDRLKLWLNSQTVSAQKIRTGSVQAGNDIESSNFVAGSTGWMIDGDGNAEFNDVTVRGILQTAASGARAEIREFGSQTYFRIFNSTELRLSMGLDSALASVADSGFLGAFNGAEMVVYSESGDVLLWADDGDIALNPSNGDQVVLAQSGSNSVPSLTFSADRDSGMYLSATGSVGMTAGGSTAMWWTNDGSGARITSNFIRDLTTGSAANVFIGAATGNLARSTSSLRYKPDWAWAKDAADYVLPTPIRWTDEKGQVRLGFGAEHIHEVVPEAFEEEIYDLRSLVAILSEKIKRLERTSVRGRLAGWLGQRLRPALRRLRRQGPYRAAQ